MKRKDVDEFEKISGQMQGFYDELSVLSKKSPNDGVNKFKLNFVNKLLNDSNEFLGEKYRPFEDFDIDDVPINSDVVFILSQYLQCFEKLRADNVKYKSTNWYWVIDAEEHEPGDESGKVYIETIRPKRLRE
ncbi:hypothetical protein H6G54_25600 [Anabaena cylindrica FACHB-243]|uniref:Uncharacterized protein n=1 Tax=Anabaena cylindrica (strain ATCC 27899 / PCC 7122) TaxID=272123 RepID=K9ZG54_ANACC|nr:MULTISPECIES: hypothetical protein [Anabaena]AFZ57345.1 hypothetical protein Anacy_1855 [Anabaena cylindrica PCC 7122]MBD2421013.1 hypothetical protein [Anabaena cylindrica FACHB-243]MBY5280717.1 hypothetical protein [Anabaena sp. CCAP 1446/1C]MBY5306416.1 hypothetical protein [Anabaena sp. CCAP 1446/1C]MCM2405766.1 hypothetical protein [Anabaena sp. CCAP 1446/1C]